MSHTNPSEVPAEQGGPTQRNEALRRRAEEIRKQQQHKQAQSRVAKQIAVIVGALVVVALIVAAVIFVPKLLKHEEPVASGPAVSGSAVIPNSNNVAVPVSVKDSVITVGAADAPVTINYWFDFSCPHCIEYHKLTEGDYNALLADGKAKIEFHPIQFVAPYGGYAGAATLVALRSQPELFFKIVDGFYAIPAETQVNWTPSDYAQAVKQFGVTDEETIKQIASGAGQALIASGTDAARDAGVQGTPSVGINGKILPELPVGKQIAEAVEKALPQGNSTP